jgi:hypothetical protein
MENEEKNLEEKKSEITKITNANTDIELKEIETKNQHYENLSLIFTIFKSILCIADQSMLEMLVSDEFMYITFGALECKI